MGCDIHIQIERRVNGAWERVPWRDRLGVFTRQYPIYWLKYIAERERKRLDDGHSKFRVIKIIIREVAHGAR